METTEIERFSLAKGIAVWGLYADPQGEWVRWEDVKVLIDIANDVLPIFKEYCDELRKQNNRITGYNEG